MNGRSARSLSVSIFALRILRRHVHGLIVDGTSSSPGKLGLVQYQNSIPVSFCEFVQLDQSQSSNEFGGQRDQEDSRSCVSQRLVGEVTKKEGVQDWIRQSQVVARRRISDVGNGVLGLSSIMNEQARYVRFSKQAQVPFLCIDREILDGLGKFPRQVMDIVMDPKDLETVHAESMKLATRELRPSFLSCYSASADHSRMLSLSGFLQLPMEADSVKRKRKKKMNKHKQRKLRRRDRHRN